MAKRRKKSTTAKTRVVYRTKPKGKKRRRVSTSRKRGMLSEFFSPGAATGGFRTTVSGAVGGSAAIIVEKAMPNQTETNQGLAMLGVAFLTATVGKMPNVGAGMAGVGAYKIAKQFSQGLSDGATLAADYANDIERLPMFLDENGQPMISTLADGSTLAQSIYQSGYATAPGGFM